MCFQSRTRTRIYRNGIRTNLWVINADDAENLKLDIKMDKLQVFSIPGVKNNFFIKRDVPSKFDEK